MRKNEKKKGKKRRKKKKKCGKMKNTSDELGGALFNMSYGLEKLFFFQRTMFASSPHPHPLPTVVAPVVTMDSSGDDHPRQKEKKKWRKQPKGKTKEHTKKIKGEWERKWRLQDTVLSAPPLQHSPSTPTRIDRRGILGMFLLESV
jgi:hypothetical protein